MKKPPKSDLQKQSNLTFNRELVARILAMVGIWTVATFLIIDPVDLFSFDEERGRRFELGIVMVTLLLSLMADQILAAIGFRNTRSAFAQSHDEILAAIEGSSQVQAFGTQTAFEQHILNRVASAVEVKNTFVGYKSARGNPAAEDPNSIECYARFFDSAGASSKPKRWVDIVSYNEFFGPRYVLLANRLKRLDGSARHVARVIRHNIPLLNFTIFYYDSFVEEREVVFGWLHSDVSHNRRLFRSTDPALIDMFEDVFTLLSQYRLQDDVEIRYGEDIPLLGSMVADRRGWWYCVGLMDGDERIVSESLFRISFREHGAEIDGIVRWRARYGGQRPGIEYISHKSDKLSYTSNKMFLEFKSSDLDRRGICVYNFSATRGKAIMNGYLQDAGSSERIQLHGIRIDELPDKAVLNEQSFVQAREYATSSNLSQYVEMLNTGDTVESPKLNNGSHAEPSRNAAE